LAFYAAQDGWLQVCHHNDLLADQIFGCIVGADPGDDLPLFRTEIDPEDEQPIRLWVDFGGNHGGHTELYLAKLIDCQHG
jgi:hypothetical protein